MIRRILCDEMVIDPDKVEELYPADGNECLLRIIGPHTSLADELNKRLSDSDARITSDHALNNYLSRCGYKEFTVKKVSENYLAIEDALMFSCTNQLFFNLKDCETVPCYSWQSSGHNWEILHLDEDAEITMLELSDENVCIATGSWEDQYVHKAFAIDGKKVEARYLLVNVSHFEGEQDAGEIMDESALREHLNDQDCDVEGCIKDINELAQ